MKFILYLIKKVLQVITHYETHTDQSNAHLNELLKSNLTLQDPKSLNVVEKKNLIDYVPLHFSRPDLLELLDDNWFQKTALVSILHNSRVHFKTRNLFRFSFKDSCDY